MNKERKRETHYDPEKLLPFFPSLAAHPSTSSCFKLLIALCLFLYCSMPPVLHLNKTFYGFYLRSDGVGGWGALYSRAHITTCMLVKPHSVLYLVFSVCHNFLCVCVCVRVLFPAACNKDSMWPPAFRLVQPINLPLYSNTDHLWPSHIPIHIFFAAMPAQKSLHH